MNFYFVGAMLILTFMSGMILGVLLSVADQKAARKSRPISIREKAPHFYDLRA